jgi:hypothetical protein
MKIGDIEEGAELHVTAGMLKGRDVVVEEVHPEGLPNLAGGTSGPCVVVRWGRDEAQVLVVSANMLEPRQ